MLALDREASVNLMSPKLDPSGFIHENLQEKERELHLGSTLTKEGEGGDLRQHQEIGPQKGDIDLRPQLGNVLIMIERGLRHQEEIIHQGRDNAHRLHLEKVHIGEGCLKSQDTLLRQ